MQPEMYLGKRTTPRDNDRIVPAKETKGWPLSPVVTGFCHSLSWCDKGRGLVACCHVVVTCHRVLPLLALVRQGVPLVACCHSVLSLLALVRQGA